MRFRTLNNETEINVNGQRVVAAQDGTFDVTPGTAVHAALLAMGALPAERILAAGTITQRDFDDASRTDLRQLGATYDLADGPWRGYRVRWGIPEGEVAPVWCHDAYPHRFP
jgi:hypothetical protein